MARKRANLAHIVNKIDAPSPAFVYTPPPTFKTKLEKQRWMAEEKRRWIEGYESLNGFHYFYLTQGFIKIGTGGKVMRPMWRDCDGIVTDALWKSTQMNWDMLLLARRELGKTSIGGALLPNYFMRVYPGSTSLLTSCDKSRISRMFNDKSMIYYNHLDKDIRGTVVRINQTKNDSYLKVQYTYLDDNMEERVAESDIYCAETTDNDQSPKAFSSIRAKYMYVDEFALHSRRAELLSSSEPCFREGTIKTGTVFCAGTVEEGIPPQSLSALRQIVADAKTTNTNLVFAPYWWGLEKLPDGTPIMINGHSSEPKAKEWREKEIDRLSKLEDKTRLKAFIKNYPESLDEALELSTEGMLPAEVMAKVSDQAKIILQNPPPVQPHKLERVGDVVKAIPDKNGKFTILTHPQPGKRYISGTDPIPFNDSRLSDGSDYCICIKESDTETYIAYYAERNLNADVVVTNAILLQDYYNKAQTMLERNVGGVVLEKYKEYGRSDLLANKPTSLGIKWVDKRVTKGYYKNDKTSAKGNELLIKHLLNNAQNIWFKRLINEIEMYLIENTDLLDAVIACEFFDEDQTRKAASKIQKPTFKMIPTMQRDSNGRTIQVWIKKRMDGKQ